MDNRDAFMVNLFLDPWIPVQSAEGLKLLALKQLLCEEKEYIAEHQWPYYNAYAV